MTLSLGRIAFLVLFFIVIIGIVVYLGLPKPTASMPHTATVTIGNTVIDVDVADTPALQTQGLSGRPSLLDGEGMLFVFQKADRYGFWMKDMRFPIDIIWIQNNSIVAINKSVDPSTYPTAYYPPTPVSEVLEVPAGFSDRHGVATGSPIVVNR